MDEIEGHGIIFESGMVEITGPRLWLKGALGPNQSTADIRRIVNFLLDEADKQAAIWNERRKALLEEHSQQ